MTTDTAHRNGILLMLSATLAWSTAGLFARAIPLDTPTVIFWRGMFGASGLIATLIVMKGAAGLRDFTRLGWAGAAYALASGIGVLAFIGALKATTIAHVAIIYATIPFVAAALGWLFLREKPSAAALIAATLALGGAAAMVGFGGDGQTLGDVLAVIMVLAMAVMIVIARARPNLPTLAAGAVSTIWAPLACLPFATTTGLTAHNMALIAGFGLINSTLGFGLFIYGSRKLPPVETALLSALETPLTPLWVWMVFGETPSLPTLLGGGVVLAAVLGYIIHENSHQRAT